MKFIRIQTFLVNLDDVSFFYGHADHILTGPQMRKFFPVVMIRFKDGSRKDSAIYLENILPAYDLSEDARSAAMDYVSELMSKCQSPQPSNVRK